MHFPEDQTRGSNPNGLRTRWLAPEMRDWIIRGSNPLFEDCEHGFFTHVSTTCKKHDFSCNRRFPCYNKKDIELLEVKRMNRKELISKVAGAIDLELSSGEITTSSTIPIENIETYAIADTMTINLKPDEGEGGDQHVAMVSVILSLNKEDDDFADKQPMLASNEGLVRNVINRVISSHTLAEIRDDQASVQTEILKELQSTFDSDFIVDVGFSSISYQ